MREQDRAGKHPSLVLRLDVVEAAQFASRAVEDDLVAVGLIEENIEIDVEPASSAGVFKERSGAVRA